MKPFLMCIPIKGLFRHLLVSVLNLLRKDQGYSKPVILNHLNKNTSPFCGDSRYIQAP